MCVMSNNKIFLFLGASLSLIPDLSAAQCVATQDCATLGYTETSCNGGKGVKCPFGNKWACLATAADFEQQFCDTYGFKYTCKGSNQKGGGGQACAGKYTYCKCASNYVWNGTACTKESCDTVYQYTCSGTGYSGGAGMACGGKYASCKCASGYQWNGTSCVKESCSSAYQYTCSGTGYSRGAGTACGGKYAYCNCASGYIWKNGKCVEPTCLRQEYVEEPLNARFKTCVLKDNVYKPVCEHIGKCYVSEIATQLKYNSYEECIRQRDCYTGAISGIGCKICTQYDI